MFQKAKPIFLKGLALEKNIQAAFLYELPKIAGHAILRITGSERYRIYFNDNMLLYGPAKAAHGHFRVDELPLDLQNGGTLRIDLSSSNVQGYDGVMHSGFLLAEVIADNAVLAATGYDFQAYRNRSRLQKVMRFGSSRQFSEVYRGWLDLEPAQWEEVEQDFVCIPRQLDMPCMDMVYAKSIAAQGTFTHGEFKKTYHWFVEELPGSQYGYLRNELEATPFDTAFSLICTPTDTSQKDFCPQVIRENEYVLYDFHNIHTGFMNLQIEVLEDTELIVSYEDICNDPYVTYYRVRNQYLNVVSWTLSKGVYTLENFDPFEMRYQQLNVIKGCIKVNSVGMRQYIGPACKYASISSGDPILDKIYEAAVSTYRQNAVDVYTDCPTRERGGWLCDSYYAAKAEYTFMGDNRLERVFLKNFVDCGQHPDLPKGMIPKNYPGDVVNGGFIPQWAMWYILQLEEALVRGPQMDKSEYRSLCYGILDFFSRYLNEDGLLESMPGWNFVEWSKCNTWVDGVNYPTNFLYSRVLKAVGTMYDDAALLAQSAQVRQTAMQLSFDGSFFTENALRDENGVLHNTGNTSETCQYYAIHFCEIDLSDPQYAVLKNAFDNVFGPDTTNYGVLGREVEPSNAFIGVYLRIECLLEHGSKEQILEQIKGFFGYMAETTGTLWENRKIEQGSINHGFASYAATAIIECLGGYPS